MRCIALAALGGMLASCQRGEPEKGIGGQAQKSSHAMVASDAAAKLPAEERGAFNEASQLVVYYFHTSYRCHSCTMIENLTQIAIKTGFADALSDGRLVYRSVNIETPDNAHFVQDYKLYTKSVVLSRRKDGQEEQWKNLEKVWTLLRDKSKFTDYITSEIKAFL